VARDWQELKLAFVADPSKPTLREFAVKKNIPLGTAQNWSAREGWIESREAHWSAIIARAAPVIAEMQVAVMARDVAQTVHHIQKMKLIALEGAGGGDLEVSYDKPADAVRAYVELHKLERLELGESTENLRVDDARNMVAEMVQAVLEVVRDESDRYALLERYSAIADRLEPGRVSARGNGSGLN